MKLNVKRTFLVGLAFMTISGFWQLYDFVIPLILKNDFHISDTLSGIVMSLDNVLALVLLPFFGSVSDKNESRFGRRMPFIVIGSILTILSMLIIPFAAQAKNFLAFTIGLALVLLSISSYRTPAIALMPDITVKPLRSSGNAIINLMGAVGGVFVLLMISILSPEKMGSYYSLFIAVATLILVAMLLMVFHVKEIPWSKEMNILAHSIENEKEQEEKDSLKDLDPKVKKSMILLLFSVALWYMGYNAVVSAFSRYATIQINFTNSQTSNILLVANIAAMISFIPIGALSNRIGRKKTILMGVITLMITFASSTLYTEYSKVMFVNFAFAGFAWAAISVNALPMVLEMSGGNETGKFVGLYYSFSMSAQIITPILSGLLFDYFTYKVLFPNAAIFSFLALLTMSQVKHGDVKLNDNGL